MLCCIANAIIENNNYDVYDCDIETETSLVAMLQAVLLPAMMSQLQALW